MKPTFHAAPVNGPFEDPALYISVAREGRALLMDSGDISSLSAGNLMKLTDVFVTHTHMDHFIGFDTILRSVLHRGLPLRVYGPENIIQCVQGKLKGYAWNLIREYPTKIDVVSVSGNLLTRAGFYAENGFQRQDGPVSEFDGILLQEPQLTVRGLQLSHGIPVMAYTVEEEYHLNINKDALLRMGLPVGPWLSEFKTAVRKAYIPKSTDQTWSLVPRDGATDQAFKPEGPDGKEFALKDLMPVVTASRGQKIAYVMDTAPTDENFSRLVPFIKASDTLFCEAYYLDKDADLALKRSHLTAAMAGRLAREAGAGDLKALHISPKYRDNPEEPMLEAMREFTGGQGD